MRGDRHPDTCDPSSSQPVFPGYRRCWADLMAGLANASTMGLTSRRGHGGRCGGGGVRSGRRRWSPWGLAGAFSGLDIASVPERLRLWKARYGADGAPGPARHIPPTALRATESQLAVSFRAEIGRG